MLLNPERSVDIAMTLITELACGELNKAAISGAEIYMRKKRIIARRADTVQAVLR